MPAGCRWKIIKASLKLLINPALKTYPILTGSLKKLTPKEYVLKVTK